MFQKQRGPDSRFSVEFAAHKSTTIDLSETEKTISSWAKRPVAPQQHRAAKPGAPKSAAEKNKTRRISTARTPGAKTPRIPHKPTR